MPIAAISLLRKRRFRSRATTCVASSLRSRMIAMKVVVRAVAAMMRRACILPNSCNPSACSQEPVTEVGNNLLILSVSIRRSRIPGRSPVTASHSCCSNGSSSSSAAACKKSVPSLRTRSSCSSATASRRRNMIGMTTKTSISTAKYYS